MAATGARPAGATDEASAALAVRQMFDSIAPRYDLLNHLLSANIDRLWWRRTAGRFKTILAQPDSATLDICCGTGDLTLALLKLRPPNATPILAADFAPAMLRRGAQKFAAYASRNSNGASSPPGAIPLETDALHLPLRSGSLDLVVTAFGFRNLSNYEAGLAEYHRVLKPGGQLGILEFSEPGGVIGKLYAVYFRQVLPAIGRLVCGKDGPYNYLPNSVGNFPAPGDLLTMMRTTALTIARGSPTPSESPACTPPCAPFSLELAMNAVVSNSQAVQPSMPVVPALSFEKRRVARRSMTAAAVMTVLKLAAGIFSGSLGMLSDAAHSGLDLAGAALTFFSVHVSDKPADEDHTYGHGKIENLSAFSEAGLMAVSCAWIIGEAIQRIFYHPVTLHHALWPVLVLFLSIAVDFWRSRELRAIAQRTGSPALATDAFHFASDIWATVAVLAGLGASWAGTRFGIGALHYADPFAAIVVSLMILRMTVRLGHEAVAALMDEIPAETQRRVVREVERVEGVLSVERARVRRAGAGYFADLTLALPRRFTFEHTSELVQAATAAVHRALPTADVVIHTIPRETRAESIFDRVRAVAARNNVSVHDLSIQSHHGRLQVELHVEIDENMRLREAHGFVTALESEIRRDVPEIDSVVTHIESEPATIEQPEVRIEEDRRMELALRAAAARIPGIVDVHAVIVGRIGDHVSLSCHCTLPDELPMHRVHDLITELEDRLKLECPEVYRVTVHPEPVTDNTR